MMPLDIRIRLFQKRGRVFSRQSLIRQSIYVTGYLRNNLQEFLLAWENSNPAKPKNAVNDGLTSHSEYDIFLCDCWLDSSTGIPNGCFLVAHSSVNCSTKSLAFQSSKATIFQKVNCASFFRCSASFPL